MATTWSFALIQVLLPVALLVLQQPLRAELHTLCCSSALPWARNARAVGSASVGVQLSGGLVTVNATVVGRVDDDNLAEAISVQVANDLFACRDGCQAFPCERTCHLAGVDFWTGRDVEAWQFQTVLSAISELNVPTYLLVEGPATE